jgi:hypothetical protein
VPTSKAATPLLSWPVAVTTASTEGTKAIIVLALVCISLASGVLELAVIW